MSRISEKKRMNHKKWHFYSEKRCKFAEPKQPIFLFIYLFCNNITTFTK